MSADVVVLEKSNLQVALHPLGYFDILIAMICKFCDILWHLYLLGASHTGFGPLSGTPHPIMTELISSGYCSEVIACHKVSRGECDSAWQADISTYSPFPKPKWPKTTTNLLSSGWLSPIIWETTVRRSKIGSAEPAYRQIAQCVSARQLLYTFHPPL